MVNEILTASGIPYRQGRYPDPPAKTYGVYFDDITTIEGPDAIPGAPLLIRHDVMVELYEPKADIKAEEALDETGPVLAAERAAVPGHLRI